MTTTPNQPDREREAREMLAKFSERDGHKDAAEILKGDGDLSPDDGSRTCIDAMLAFRDADRAGEGEEPVQKLHKFADRHHADCGLLYEDGTDECTCTPATPLLDDETVERCAEICEERAQDFLSPEYATNQPLSSFQERFACGQCASAIRALKRSAK